jgi:beta-glucosidase
MVQNKAKTSELALITIRNAGEGDDRKIDEDFNLAQDEINMINIVSQAFHAPRSGGLNIGGVIETASWKDKVDAILLPWQPGQEGGNSVADVFRKSNPSES